MKILLKSVQIINTGSPHHDSQKDILVENGIIQQIDNQIDTSADEVVQGEDFHVSVGWFDLRVHATEPGYEHRETLASMSQAAQRGGFTEVALLPNTKPTIQTKESVLFLKQSGENQLVSIHPIAAVTLNTEGKDFTEMLDLYYAGAVAFSDGNCPITHPDILLKTLQYLDPVGGLLMNRPEETLLSRYGQMHEGMVSTSLGMKGLPAMAEEIAVMRDLQLLVYTGITSKTPRLHFSLISAAKSVALIREAKQKGLPVSCDVAAHQLVFDDASLVEFDTNLKVNPPFRTRLDIDALWQGLSDGTIDAVVSDHHPHDEEGKNLEFDLAEFGVIGLETSFAALNMFNTSLQLSQLIDKITTQPRRILGKENPKIEVGTMANLTVFSPSQTWTYQQEQIRSKSKNSPFIGQTFQGRAVAILNKGKFAYAQ